jgi:hypothetical protein
MTEFAIICISLISILLMIFISAYIGGKKSDRCCNGGNQHNFKPRYDEIETHCDITGNLTPEDARKMLIKNVYIKDICIWCGKEIKK